MFSVSIREGSANKHVGSAASSVPDHVKNPHNYTCYTLDWSDDEDGARAGLSSNGHEASDNHQALQDALAAAAACRQAKAGITQTAQSGGAYHRDDVPVIAANDQMRGKRGGQRPWFTHNVCEENHAGRHGQG